MLTHERLLELLHYDPITGNFTWRIDRRGHSRAGDLAGTVHRKGYRYVAVDGKKHAAHRLAFFYMNAEWPSGEIDHINLCRADNRWCNLRVATGAQNKANTSVRQDNTSGYKGVSWDRHRAKWRAGISQRRKNIHLGTFGTAEAAHAAYVAAAQSAFGAFARAS